MHLTYRDLQDQGFGFSKFVDDVNLDEAFFYSVPTSFFVIDQRIPRILRKLITEAEGCLKMNYLTGASACTRKAIYELLGLAGAVGQNYDEKIKDLKSRNLDIDAELFDIIGHIKDMTSDHVHEQSWIAWDSSNLCLFLETLRTILHEIYVVPEEKKDRISSVRTLREQLGKVKNGIDTETEPEGNVTKQN